MVGARRIIDLGDVGVQMLGAGADHVKPRVFSVSPPILFGSGYALNVVSTFGSTPGPQGQVGGLCRLQFGSMLAI